MSRETVLVTGASSGIGSELAILFARDGARVVLVARRADRLAELARALPGESEVIVCDLAVPGAAHELCAELGRRGLGVDIVVNNAGFGLLGAFHQLPREKQLAMIQLNVMALTELTHRLLPGMIERRRGGVLNVASTAAFQPGPEMAVYYASKAFVLSLTEAIHEELRGTGVTASCLCPGPTRTEFADVAEMTETRLFRLGVQSAAAVAAAGHRGFRRGRPVIVPGVASRLGVLAVRLAPRAIVRKTVRWMQGSR